MRRFIPIGLIITAATLGGSTATAAALPTIVFDSSTSRYQIYGQSAGETPALFVKDGPGSDFGAARSPGGRSIALSRRANGNYDIFTAPVAGGPLVRKTTNPGIDAFPSWSTAGIAFESNRAAGNYDIYVTSGGHVTRLTTNKAVDALPTWAPDTRHIAFDSNRNGKYQIFRIPTTGRGVATALTPPTRNSVQPAWAPDGKSIAFAANTSGPYQIYVVDTASLAITQLTSGTADSYQPAWSPDGSHIAYVTNAGGHQRIWTMRADGGGAEQYSSQGGEQPEYLANP